MPLVAGARIGPYEIVAKVGEGGMGEVYRARDTRLERTVAIKILPATLEGDAQFRERFEREARALSQFTHPHICTLHDLGREDGIDFLVLEYLEGVTLESRLANGPLPFDEALRIAIDIGGALVAAHRAGIIHRDLKPGNVVLTKAGAKLVDFGLAKTSVAAVVSSGLSMLPTTPPNLTAQGAILGTFQYMAPEQIEGIEADARTDIFAFGCVLYEMLTGHKAFEGKTRASLLGAILKDEPRPVSQVQPLASPELDRVVGTCLAKDPDERWQTARDLLRELEWATKPRHETATSTPARARGRWTTLAWTTAVVSALALVGAAGIVARHWREPLRYGAANRHCARWPNACVRGHDGRANTAVDPTARGFGRARTAWNRWGVCTVLVA